MQGEGTECTKEGRKRERKRGREEKMYIHVGDKLHLGGKLSGKGVSDD